MNLRIITWNVRGLNDPNKRKVIKLAVRKWKAHVLCLQETKMNSLSGDIVKSLWGSRWVEWEIMEANGTAGGILLCWDSRWLAKVDVRKGLHSVSCVFKCVCNDMRWFFSGVYGPSSEHGRRELWRELVEVCQSWSMPWCVGGDFNEIRFPHERLGCMNISRGMSEFSNFINSCNLVDLPLYGSKFSWVKGGGGHSMSRIDRLLVSSDWEDFFPRSQQSTLPRPVSDHFPLCLDCGALVRGKSPFRFENMWLREEGFKNLLGGGGPGIMWKAQLVLGWSGKLSC